MTHPTYTYIHTLPHLLLDRLGALLRQAAGVDLEALGRQLQRELLPEARVAARDDDGLVRARLDVVDAVAGAVGG